MESTTPSVDPNSPRAEASQHGTVEQFWLGCRCLLCRSARARYRAERRVTLRVLVTASQVHLDHIADLRRQGMGMFAIAEAAGMSHTTVRTILRGHPTDQGKLDRLMAVQLELADGARIPSFRYRRMIETLLGEEYTRERIEQYLGRQLRLGSRITVRKAHQIEALFRRLTG